LKTAVVGLERSQNEEKYAAMDDNRHRYGP
jgi:hypothetical protein